MDSSVAVLLFDGVTALDAVGPYEVLTRIPLFETVFVAAEPGLKRTSDGRLGLCAVRRHSDLAQPDVVVVRCGQSQRRSARGAAAAEMAAGPWAG